MAGAELVNIVGQSWKVHCIVAVMGLNEPKSLRAAIFNWPWPALRMCTQCAWAPNLADGP
jgi:hypothetical protein